MMVVGALLPLLLALQGSRRRNKWGRKREERALRGGAPSSLSGFCFLFSFLFCLESRN